MNLDIYGFLILILKGARNTIDFVVFRICGRNSPSLAETLLAVMKDR